MNVYMTLRKIGCSACSGKIHTHFLSQSLFLFFYFILSSIRHEKHHIIVCRKKEITYSYVTCKHISLTQLNVQHCFLLLAKVYAENFIHSKIQLHCCTLFVLKLF